MISPDGPVAAGGGMALQVARFLGVVLTAVAMASAFAHLLALPNKIGLPRDAYFTVQQIYRGWALLGVVILGALLSTLTVAILVRRHRRAFTLTIIAAACLVLSLVVFFTFTYPANQQTENWTVMPSNWMELRRQWEYSHAVGAGLYFMALATLTASLLVGRR
jgi:hypothetical protein